MALLLASGAWMATDAAAVESSPSAFATPALATADPTDTPDPTPTPTMTPTITPWATATPTDTPDPSRAATPALFNYDIYKDGTFVSQNNNHECMAAALQNMLNIIGPNADRSVSRQTAISMALMRNTTKDDSHNGGYGPLGWAITLQQFGAGNYKLIIDDNLNEAMGDAAYALRRTGRPVGLLAWWGAHAWVMTGFRSDRDPRRYSTFTFYGAYIVDPFYPRHSSIWGYTMGPDTYRNMSDMTHNFIGWKRPEGHYSGRDGRWLLVIPY